MSYIHLTTRRRSEIAGRSGTGSSTPSSPDVGSRRHASLGVPVYFADPYASWQRGSNENANGLLREFFPKGTDFAQVAHDELADALAKINGRPRKCLDWKTAHEAFAEEVLRLI